MRHVSSVPNTRGWLRAILCCGLLQAAIAQAATIDLVKNLYGVRGLAFDEVNSRLLFFQKQNPSANASWDLKSLQLTPQCKEGMSVCATPTTVSAGFYQPGEVAVNAEAGVAYVTQADTRPLALLGTSVLIRVDLKNGTKKEVAFLDGSGQISLAPEINAAYVSGRRSLCNFDPPDEPCPFGWISRVDLTTGAGVTLAEGPAPFGLVHTKNRERAYVTRSDQVVEIDLSTGKQIRTVTSNAEGVDALTNLAWADTNESVLYLLEVDESFAQNKVFRIDLITSEKTLVADNLGGVLYGIAVDPSGDSLYLSLSSKVVRIPLFTLSATEPVFIRIGDVPVTSIDTDGYANSKPGDKLQVVDAPFGGTLDIFGNLLNFSKLNATAYRVLVSRDGGPFNPIVASWTTSRWNENRIRFESVVIAPITGTDLYAIPKEYSKSATVPFWPPPFRMLRWQTSEKGKYELKVEIFNIKGKDITYKLPAGKNSLIMQIDNLPPAVDLTGILLSSGEVVEPCTIVRSPAENLFKFKLTAGDPHGHLAGYSLSALWGRDQSGEILFRSYPIDEDGPHLWRGVENTVLPDDKYWSATCNCAYTFVLDAWKRTINGYNSILRSSSRQSVTIDNANASCSGL